MHTAINVILHQIVPEQRITNVRDKHRVLRHMLTKLTTFDATVICTTIDRGS